VLSTLGIDMPTAILLCLAVLLALSFEFVNGFHDTANAVATVIYTHSLKPSQAVVWSGMWNLIGVLTSSGAVAFGIVALLPVELVINVGSGAGFAMVFALLISSIVWNLGTWYLGLPASSSHTLIGSIVGVGLMNSLMSPDSAFGEGVNWIKVEDTVKALIFSPLLGFCAAALLLLAAKALIRNPALYRAPEGNKPPPMWIRALLVFTCTGVSFAHGSNDGQKGHGPDRVDPGGHRPHRVRAESGHLQRRAASPRHDSGDVFVLARPIAGNSSKACQRSKRRTSS
jgi:PiT family inorganic phosphate transporter